VVVGVDEHRDPDRPLRAVEPEERELQPQQVAVLDDRGEDLSESGMEEASQIGRVSHRPARGH
jgi:hypothetical protein